MGQNIPKSFRNASELISDEAITEMVLSAYEALHDVMRYDSSAVKTLACIIPELAISNSSSLYKFYELDMYLRDSKINPELTVLSGSGARVDEVLAFQNNGRKNIIAADPHSTYSAKTYSRNFSALEIYHRVENKSRNIQEPYTGIFLTNDSHDDLVKAFKDKKVDELAIIRLDPDSLLAKGTIDDATQPSQIAMAQVEAVGKLVNILSMVKDEGEATITVGLGNSSLSYLFRKVIIFSLNELCQRAGIHSEILGSPWLNLYFGNGGKPDSENPLLKGILRSASLDGVRIIGSPKLHNLSTMLNLQSFQRTLRECLSEGLTSATSDTLIEQLLLNNRQL